MDLRYNFFIKTGEKCNHKFYIKYLFYINIYKNVKLWLNPANLLQPQYIPMEIT